MKSESNVRGRAIVGRRRPRLHRGGGRACTARRTAAMVAPFGYSWSELVDW
jgi:hypothetical protein